MAKKVYTDEMKDYMAEIVPGRRIPEITKLLNSKFDTDFSEARIRGLKSRLSLKNGLSKMDSETYKKNRLMTPDQESFALENLKGISIKEQTKRINTKFGTNFNPEQIRSWRKNNNHNSGLTGRFEKGHVPAIKGTKGIMSPNKTSFKPGDVPANYLPIGTVRVNGYGYLIEKVQDKCTYPQRWKMKHRLDWERKFGEIPEAHVLIFLDGNKENIEFDNLRLVHRSVLAKLNIDDGLTDDREINDVLVRMAQVTDRVRRIENGE